METLHFFGSGGYELLSIKKPLSAKQGKDILLKANALIRYHLKIDPDELSDDKYSEIWQGLRWTLEFEAKRFSLKEGQNSITF